MVFKIKIDFLGELMGAVFDLRPWRFFSSLMLINKSPLLAFDDLIQRHGPIIRISMFGHHTILLGGLDEIKEFTRMEETTTRPYNQVLLDLYSGGEALGFGIGHSALKSGKM